jgi:hypothetical protein
MDRSEEHVDVQLRGWDTIGELEQVRVRGDALADRPVRRVALAVLVGQEADEPSREGVTSCGVDVTTLLSTDRSHHDEPL